MKGKKESRAEKYCSSPSCRQCKQYVNNVVQAK